MESEVELVPASMPPRRVDQTSEVASGEIFAAKASPPVGVVLNAPGVVEKLSDLVFPET